MALRPHFGDCPRSCGKYGVQISESMENACMNYSPDCLETDGLETDGLETEGLLIEGLEVDCLEATDFRETLGRGSFDMAR